jgi:H+-transporting ATPase
MAPPEHAGVATSLVTPHPGAGATATLSPDGLTTAEANQRLVQVGPNSLPDTTLHPLLQALKKLWAPVPWMLEAAMVLELVLGDFTEAAVIFGLLTFNAGIGLYQEGKAQTTLAALKSRLALNASVRRDGKWGIVASEEVVPGDLVKLSLGAVVPADVSIVEGSVLLDQSSLTGESEPVELGAGAKTFAGALVQRGEASAQVTDTGPRTKSGNSAELVRTAHVESSQQKVVLRVVRNIALFNGATSWPWWCTRPAAGGPGARLSRSSSPRCWQLSRWHCLRPSPWPPRSVPRR